jgi:hypothetical protein
MPASAAGIRYVPGSSRSSLLHFGKKMDYSAAGLRLARHRTQAARAAKAPALGEVQGLGFVRLEPAPWEGLSVRV